MSIKAALALGIITDDIYTNTCSNCTRDHQPRHPPFIISEITLAEVEQIAYDYYFFTRGTSNKCY